VATLTWLNEICEAQKGLALNVDPVITIQKLKEERKSVISFCKPIVNTPKPIPVVEKKEEEEEEDIDTSNTGTTERTAEDTAERTSEGINAESTAESTAEGKSDPMDVDEPEVDLSGKDADGDTNMNDAA